MSDDASAQIRSGSSSGLRKNLSKMINKEKGKGGGFE